MSRTLEEFEQHGRCLFCDAPLSKNNTEKHHFPIPASLGGKDTVDCCITCHDRIDRFGVKNLGIDFLYKGFIGAFDCGMETRIFMAKLIKMAAHGARRKTVEET